MKILTAHLATDVLGGEYRRIFRLNKDLVQVCDSSLIEVRIVKIHKYFLGRPRNLSPLCPGGVVIDLPIILPGVRFKFVRFINRWLLWLFGYIVGAFQKADITVGETHGVYPFVAGVKAATCESKVIFDIHGAYPEEILYAHGETKGNARHAIEYSIIEKKIIDNSDIVFCQSDAMVEHLKNKHGLSCTKKIEVYQCGVDLSVFKDRSAENKEIREILGYAAYDKVFVYLGGVQKWQLFDKVLSIFSAIVKTPRKFSAKLLVITSEPVSSISRFIEEHEIDSGLVKIVSAPHSEVPNYLSLCDYGFLLREENILNVVACPTKLGEYLACGIVVITSGVSRFWGWTRYESSDVFCCVDYNDVNLSAEKIVAHCDSVLDRNDSIRSKCRQVAANNLSSVSDYKSLCRGIEGIL